MSGGGYGTKIGDFVLQPGDVMREEKAHIISVCDGPSYLATFAECTGKETPVGTVEWTRVWCENFGITLPQIKHEDFDQCYGRRFERMHLSDCTAADFVKPVDTKLFNASLYSGLSEETKRLDIEVYAQEIVKFTHEWRVYLCEFDFVGCSRYDDNDDELSPSMSKYIERAVRRYAFEIAHEFFGYKRTYCSIDVGIRDDGVLCLVEINDGWSLGSYRWGPRPISSKSYADLVECRWKQILENQS